jgi:hypothetical protein
MEEFGFGGVHDDRRGTGDSLADPDAPKTGLLALASWHRWV